MPTTNTSVDKESAIRSIVRASVESYAAGFKTRHITEKDDPNGVLNMKIHNVFIAALGPEIQYYSALSRSLDSSLGNMLEKMAINIAKLSYDVAQSVEGPLYQAQTIEIAKLLEAYKNHRQNPIIADYRTLENKNTGKSYHKTHISDYYLYDRTKDEHHLIELKIGGDLDNKKARSEKEAILEQYAILSNNLGSSKNVFIHFATGYNRYGEGKPWIQERVRQFFSAEELLIGQNFWNFITKSQNGYQLVLDEYRKSSHLIIDALNEIKQNYIGAI